MYIQDYGTEDFYGSCIALAINNHFMDVGTGGTGCTCPPNFSKIRAKCPFSCSLVAPFKALKIQRSIKKMHVSKFSGRTCFRTPLADLHLKTGAMTTLFHHAKCFVISLGVLAPDKVLNLTFRSPAEVPFELSRIQTRN